MQKANLKYCPLLIQSDCVYDNEGNVLKARTYFTECLAGRCVAYRLANSSCDRFMNTAAVIPENQGINKNNEA